MLSAGLQFFLEAPVENIFPYLFHLLEAACIPWLMALSFIHQTSNPASSNLITSLWPLLPLLYIILWFSLSSLLLSLISSPMIYWVHLGNPGQCPYCKTLNLIISARYPLSSKLIHSRFWRLGHGHLWEVIILSTTANLKKKLFLPLRPQRT